MKINHVRISNFRALHNVELQVSDYMSLVGPNGAGKSSILYALDWFFGNRDVNNDCLSYEPDSNTISVEASFEGLPDRLRNELGFFALDGTLRLKKSYDCNDGSTSFTGLASTGYGFSAVLKAPSAAEMRESYRNLRTKHEGLEQLSGSFGKDRIQEAFSTWCMDEANHTQLVNEEMDASHIFRRDGILSRHFKFILVQGALDFADEIDTKDRNSLMSVLTKNLLDTPKKPIIDTWKETHKKPLVELERSLIGAVNNSLASLTRTVNANLNRYDRNISVQLEATNPGIDIAFPSSIDARVVGNGGRAESIAAQGHGVQRTVVMSMIEALNASDELDDMQSEILVIIAAEEPELYQHPVRARSFSRTLSSLAYQDGFQIMIATHSPEFVSSDFISSLRLVRKHGIRTNVKSTTLEAVANVRKKHKNEIHEWLTKELPKSMADAFFADLVLLTEGETDEALWPEIAELLDQTFDHHGVVCMSVNSKTNLIAIREVLSEFGVDSYLIADGDFVDDNSQSQQEQTEQLVKAMNLIDDEGKPKYVYGDESQVFDHIAILRKRIEEELAIWPSFQAAMVAVNPRAAKKKAHHYRMATRKSSVEGIPPILKQIVNRVVANATQFPSD